MSDKPRTNNDGQLSSVTGGNDDILKKDKDQSIKIETGSTGNKPAEPSNPSRKEEQ
jgi:hypothetical protein